MCVTEWDWPVNNSLLQSLSSSFVWESKIADSPTTKKNLLNFINLGVYSWLPVIWESRTE